MKRKLLATLLALCLIVGMIPVAASANSMTDCPGGDTCTHAAAIGDTHYDTLQEAIDAVSANENNHVIEVLRNLQPEDVGAEKQEMRFTKEGQSVTLELNQHEITTAYEEAIHINAANVTLTIQNGTIRNYYNIGNYSDGLYAFQNSNNLTLTLDNVTLDSRTQTLAVQGLTSNSNVTIRNSTLNSDEQLGIYYPPKSGVLTIENSVITAGTGVVVKGGTVNILGEETKIVTDGNKVVPEDYYTGATDGSSSLTMTGDALYVESGYNDRDIVVNVQNGTLKSTNSYAIQMFVKTDEEVAVKRDVAVSGGTFSSDVSEYVADGYTMVESESGYTVEILSAENAVASVGTGENVNYYKTVAEAVENANNGTATLLQNATFDTLPLSSDSVIVDLNGYTLTSVSGETSVIQNGADLTIQDSKGTGTLVYNGITDPAKAAFEVQVGSSISLKGIRYETSGTGVYAWGNATTVNIEDVVIDSSGYCVGTNAGETENYRVNINITNSQLTSALEGAGTAVLFNVPGTLNIDDSTLNGHWQGLIARGGNITISNSVITNTYDTLNTNYEQAWGSGNAVTLAGITIGNKGNNAYDYPVSIKLENTSVTSVGPNPAIYVYQMTGDNRKVTVAISGDSAVSGDFIVEKDEGVESVDVAISGGYFTSDPSEYVAKGKVAVESDEPGYNYMVTDANTEAPAEVVTAEPNANVSDSITEEADKEAAGAIQSALDANVVSGDGLTAAANTVANDNEVTVEQGKAALKEANISVSGKTVSIAIQPYMDISIDAVDMAAKTVTLDITPMYRTVATTADLDSDGKIVLEKGEGEVNAVQIGDPRPLEINKPVTITLTLPANFATPNETLYIQHIKDGGRTYYYTGTVDTGTVDSKNLTFTNPNGFSTFTVSTTNGAVAEVEGIGYANFQDAVDAVENGGTINVLKSGDYSVSGNKTFSITYGAGIAVTLKAATGYVLTQEGKNTYTIAYAGGGTPSEPEEPTWPFTDVTEGDDWFYDAVAYVYENGIMAGTDETTFEPTMELDRAMAAQLFYNLEGKPAVTGDSTFTDVTSGHWAVDAITWAAQNDIVAGIGGGLYDPDSNVTREQFAQMLYNYAQYKGYDLTATGDLTQFPDAGSISSWAETALSWANGKGLINGHENGTIDPKGSTIRAQAASIMANFDQNVAK